MADGAPTISDSSSFGATVRHNYVTRVITTYPVTDSEISTLSILNTGATLFFSLATLLAGLGASIETNAIFYTALTPAGELAVRYVAPGLFWGAGGSAVLAAILVCMRGHRWRKIKSQAVQVQTSSQPAAVAVAAASPVAGSGKAA